MTLLFVDGFDHYNLADLDLKYNTIPSSSYQDIQPAYSRFLGTNKMGLRMRSNLNYNSSNKLRKDFTASSTIIMGFAIWLDSGVIPTANNDNCFLYLKDGSTSQIKTRLNSDYTITVLNGDNTELGTTTESIKPYTWFYFEIKVFVSLAVGTVDIMVNETSWLSLISKVTQVSGTATIDEFELGNNYNTIYTHYDDLYVANAQGSVNNDFLGEIVIETLRPNGAGNYSQWTPSAGLNYENVDDAVDIDEDSTYNSHNTLTEKDSYTLADMASSGIAIKGVGISICMRKDDASARSIRPFVRVNSTDYPQDTQDLEDNYKVTQVIEELNPDDSAAWEEVDINSLELGVEVIS